MSGDYPERLSKSLYDICKNLLLIERRPVEFELSGHKLTLGDCRFLSIIMRCGESGLSVGELSKRLRISVPSATIAADKLEAKGLITRRRHEDDGRVVLLGLTAEGVTASRECSKFHRDLMERVCSEYRPDELEMLVSVMEKFDGLISGVADSKI